jgi:hypothetical protein
VFLVVIVSQTHLNPIATFIKKTSQALMRQKNTSITALNTKSFTELEKSKDSLTERLPIKL